jgi:pyruvate formate lyase activating enzyme
MKEALFYKKTKEGMVQCQLCPHFCAIKKGERGKCGVRENKAGKLYSLIYSKPCSLAVDPIEKKPLYHFMPGQPILSIGTVGCNLKCKFCQNCEISQARPEQVYSRDIFPEEIIHEAKKQKIKMIAYTYNEPTIFYEYLLEIAKLAKKAGIKNVIVSNGFINPAPLRKLCRYIDAANIDLKGIEDDFYNKICGARVAPVLETLKILKKEKVWLEITNLIIPTLNDYEKDIKKLVDWVTENLGKESVLHFTAFYPQYKLAHLPPTSLKILENARKIALDAGLKYAYTGNIQDNEGDNTYCPKCNKLLIKRRLFSIIENNLSKGKCKYCHAKIDGVWS